MTGDGERDGLSPDDTPTSVDGMGWARAALASGRRFGFLDPRRISAVYLWIGFVILFTALKPGIYLSSINLSLIFTQGPVTCILALAFLVPLVAGAYDLSVGAVMALAIGLSVWIQIHAGLSPVLGAVVAIICCASVGFVSGTVVVKLKVNSFIATLAMSEVLLAAVLVLSEIARWLERSPTRGQPSARTASAGSRSSRSTLS